MFDVSFQKSALYFSMLQILRIVKEWIQETRSDLDNYATTFRGDSLIRHCGRDGAKILNENWETVLAHFAEVEGRFLQRLGDKSEEIKSLRDGVSDIEISLLPYILVCSYLIPIIQLFNANSLLEASKSTTMNRYIIVFTTMTIFFLPLSFITVS
jgi:hypothetical protein